MSHGNGRRVLEALLERTKHLHEADVLAINQLEALDLRGLSTSDFVAFGINTSKAEEIASALASNNFQPLADIRSIREIRVAADALSLLPV